MNPKEIKKFFSKIEKTKTCWIWTGADNGAGYGRFHSNYSDKRVHRVSYEFFTGEKIPKGLVIDHLCRNRKCVNPDHLEVVSHKVNILRGNGVGAVNKAKTHCKFGHEFSGDNLAIQIRPNGAKWRICVTCKKTRYKNNKEKKS